MLPLLVLRCESETSIIRFNMKPFLILQLRKNDQASDGEYEAFLDYGNLDEKDTVRVRMDRGELPEVNLNDYSGAIVGGGPWNVSDPDAKKSQEQKQAELWLGDLFAEILERDFPYLGACYGFGVLAHLAGGRVDKGRYGEDPGAVRVHLSNEGNEDPLLKDLPTSFDALVGHKEACEELPEGAVLLGGSDTCPHQMFRIKNNIYTTQFHPELDVEGICVRIDVYKNAGYFPPEDAEKLKVQCKKETIDVPMEILRRFVKRYTQQTLDSTEC